MRLILASILLLSIVGYCYAQIACAPPKCQDGCTLDNSAKPCPACRCDAIPEPRILCSPPKCGDGCSLDYSTKPCPSCKCRKKRQIACSVPKCADGCFVNYKAVPCPSCMCPQN